MNAAMDSKLETNGSDACILPIRFVKLLWEDVPVFLDDKPEAAQLLFPCSQIASLADKCFPPNRVHKKNANEPPPSRIFASTCKRFNIDYVSHKINQRQCTTSKIVAAFLVHKLDPDSLVDVLTG
jgi:hypothetical protein